VTLRSLTARHWSDSLLLSLLLLLSQVMSETSLSRHRNWHLEEINKITHTPETQKNKPKKIALANTNIEIKVKKNPSSVAFYSTRTSKCSGRIVISLEPSGGGPKLRLQRHICQKWCDMHNVTWRISERASVLLRSTQPCILPGSLNRVPASAGVKAGKSPLPGGR